MLHLDPNIDSSNRIRVAVHEAGHVIVRTLIYGPPESVEITEKDALEYDERLGGMRPPPPLDALPLVAADARDQRDFVLAAMVYLGGAEAVALLDPTHYADPDGEPEERPGDIGSEMDQAIARSDLCWRGAGGDAPLPGLLDLGELYEAARTEARRMLSENRAAVRALAFELNKAEWLSKQDILEVLERCGLIAARLSCQASKLLSAGDHDEGVRSI